MKLLFTPRQFAVSEDYAQGFQGLVPDNDLYKIAVAYRIGHYVHRDKKRCDKRTPFFHHPITVTDIRANGIGLRWMPPELRVIPIVTCLLHDTVEENPELVTTGFLTMVFEEQVVRNLDFVTKPPGYDREVYYGRLMACTDPEPIIDKLCDNLHNSCTLGKCPEAFQLRQIRETDFYYVPLAKRLIELLPKELEWIGYYLLESLEAECRSYKREFGLEIFPET